MTRKKKKPTDPVEQRRRELIALVERAAQVERLIRRGHLEHRAELAYKLACAGCLLAIMPPAEQRVAARGAGLNVDQVAMMLAVAAVPPFVRLALTQPSLGRIVTPRRQWA